MQLFLKIQISFNLSDYNRYMSNKIDRVNKYSKYIIFNIYSKCYFALYDLLKDGTTAASFMLTFSNIITFMTATFRFFPETCFHALNQVFVSDGCIGLSRYDHL